MLPPPVCYSCGTPIGDVAEMYQAERARRVRVKLAERNIQPRRALLDAADLQIDMADYLDRLQARNECCRTHIVTNMDWRHYY